MRELISQNHVIHIYSMSEKISSLSYLQADYIISRIETLDTTAAEQLFINGFHFHDRKLRVEINLKESERFGKQLKREKACFELRESGGGISEDVYALACCAFKHDRRFHLEQHFDQNLADQIIRAYLTDFGRKDLLVFQASHEKELLGFIIIEKHLNGECENLLGAVKPGIKGKLIAHGLYENVLKALAEGSYGSVQKYYGDVSSANPASLNLHMQLGAKIKETYDEWIYRNTENRRQDSCRSHQ